MQEKRRRAYQYYCKQRKKLKNVHIHVDQLNSADEKETELLARKVIESLD